MEIITKGQKEILLFLYAFRFLTTNQIQKLLGHKLPTHAQNWLTELYQKGYVGRIYSRKTLATSSEPAIYYLKPLGRKLLKNEKKCDLGQLDKVYKEGKRKERFIKHCLEVADMRLFFESRQEKDQKLHFFTRAELGSYEYFPENLPDAYIAVKNGRKTRRYFLDVFDPFTPPFVLRNRVKAYLDYARERKWQSNTDNSALPSILFVCPNRKLQQHIYHYSKAKLGKVFDDKISLFLTTKDSIESSKDLSSVWQRAG